MKIRLVQTGGFIGRTKIAEEELADHSAALIKEINQLFAVAGNTTHSISRTSGADRLQYFVEFENKRLPIADIVLSAELDKVIKKLMSQLHY